MYLIIDVGNTFVKLAVFENNKLKNKQVVKLNKLLEETKHLKNSNLKIKQAIISSVGKLTDQDISVLKVLFDLTILNSDTKLPFNNLYQTPTTLGVDRIALVCAAVKQFPKQNTLIIDAGTCITYDFINANNDYLGGAISPGLRMRYAALNNLTANLPLLDKEIPESIIGNTTKSAIHSGVVNGVINEINGNIATYKHKYLDLTIILTGGDANFLSKQLKSSIFVNSNFLLEGLYSILQFNSN